VIVGRDEHNHDVSLYCGGVGASSASFGLKSIKCRPLRAILGDEFNSWVTTKFKTGVARYTLLHNWMGSTLFDITQPPGLTDRIEVRARDKLQVQLPSAVEFVILPTYSRATDGGKVTLNEDHLVEFRFDETVAIDTISDKYIQKFRRFLSLMTQRPVFIEEIKLRSNEWKTCELLHENRGVEEAERDLIHQHILVSYHDIKERFSEVLQKWYELEAQVEDALDLYFATIFNPNLYSHQVILSLAQALEVYHRSSPSFEGCLQPKIEFRERKRRIVEAVPEEAEWLNEKLAHANEKTLAQRLKPEQEQVIGRAIEAGLIETAEQAVEVGVETIRQRLKGRGKMAVAPAGNLAALFANSPFAGLNIDFERDEDPGRAVEL